MSKICYGCGAQLQTKDKEKKGYIPEHKLADSSYCMRCFRMMHYGDGTRFTTPKEAKEIINKVNKDNKFVIFLVDFLNLNEDVIKLFKSITKRKLLVINKCELLPDSINPQSVFAFVQDYYKIKDPIRLKGGTTTHGASVVKRFLLDNYIKEAYVLGISNSGKSTFINDMAKLYGCDKKKINVSSKANTTLDFIRMNLNDELLLIDSPGFILENAVEHDVVNKNITDYIIQIKENDTVSLLDDKYFFKFEEPTPINFFTNAKCEKAIKKYRKVAPGLSNILDLEHGKIMDIVIKGVGFIRVKKGCVVTTNVPKKNIEIRESLFGGNHE